MRLTSYTDYALRSLIFLAVHSDRPLVNISDIADTYGISKSHLTKVIHQLATLGYVSSVRGKGGGIRLGIAPDRINIGKLVRQTEADFAMVECLAKSSDKKTACVIAPACTLKGVIAEATKAFLHSLDQYTLADIIKDPEAVRLYL